MIITFRSAAAGDVIMFGDVAKHMLEIIGKPFEDKGIITVEQLPAAIAALRAAIAADKVQRAGITEEEPQPGESRIDRPVSLAQRAVPLAELFEWALKKNKAVTWNV